MTAVIAHRGGALLWPENSRAAIEGAIRLGVDQVQLDVQPSRDGRIVLLHDPTLDRTTTGIGLAVDQDWAELRRITLRGTSETLVPLEEAIEILRPSPMRLRVEIKRNAAALPHAGFADAVRSALRAALFMERTVVSSFAPEDLDPADPLAAVWLVSAKVLEQSGWPALIRNAQRRGIKALAVRWTALDGPGIGALRAASFAIGCFGCHDAAALIRVLDMQLDELSTDRPDLALELRDQHSR